MTGADTVFHYAAFGWTIASDYALPLLRPAPPPNGEHDIRIRIGAVEPEQISRTQYRSRRIFDQLRYVVDAGRDITVEPLEGSNPANVASLTVSRLLTVACYHRGQLPLHASAVRIGDRLVAICGLPGSGKSTLAALLIERGGQLLEDDMVVVGGSGPFHSLGPGSSGMKLSEASLHRIGRNPDGLEFANEVEEKYILPVAALEPSVAAISTIVQMRHGAAEMRKASAVEAVAGWKICVRQPELLEEAPDPQAVWQNWLDLVANVDNVIISHGGEMEASARFAELLVSTAAA